MEQKKNPLEMSAQEMFDGLMEEMEMNLDGEGEKEIVGIITDQDEAIAFLEMIAKMIKRSEPGA